MFVKDPAGNFKHHYSVYEYKRQYDSGIYFLKDDAEFYISQGYSISMQATLYETVSPIIQTTLFGDNPDFEFNDKMTLPEL